MLTEPMTHQIEGRQRLRDNPEFYALGCEQGTGKTWMLLDDIEYQLDCDVIDAVLVIAPKGVHTNWVLREVPKHIGKNKWHCAYWTPENTKKATRLRKRALESDKPVLFAMNIDAVNTERGYAFAAQLLKTRRCMMVVDESSRIKSPTAGRTKKMIKLGALAVSRRIASGTLMPNAPFDVFTQFEFLKPNGELLGTTSYRAFVARHAKLMPEGSPLYQKIIEKSRGRGRPQIVQRDSSGRPIYRNLDMLAEFMQPYCYRVTKDECLDLPPKVYQTVGFDLSPAQRKQYQQAEDDLRLEVDGSLEIFDKIVSKTKLRQIVSCFFMVDGEPTKLMDSNPRLDVLKEIIEDSDGSVIIWASFREEIRLITEYLESIGATFVQYHGGTSKDDREKAIDDFQSGDARFFVGNPQAAGIGLTLTAATTVVYYSNSYNLELRLQSEDRSHRIGTESKVTYIDIVANDTIDEKVVEALQGKKAVQEYVMERI